MVTSTPNWRKLANTTRYRDILEERLTAIPPLSTELHSDHFQIQTVVDDHIEGLSHALFDAARESQVISSRRYKPKKYWCPELSRARDTKRFWWRMWNDNGRPRQGEVYRCYKNVKKIFRKLSRQSIFCKNNEFHESLNELLKRDSVKFWRTIKKTKKSATHSKVDVQVFKKHFSSIMQDVDPILSPAQRAIADAVNEKYLKLHDSVMTDTISTDQIESSIRKLKRNSSPGIDGITGEYLINGTSDTLRTFLVSLYTIMLKYNCVPTIFNTGVMVPVLKKPTLNPSDPSSYRPIIISSVFSKLFELLIIPSEVPLCNNQFGFRAGYGVYNGLNMLNDLMCYCKGNDTNIFLCSLDAEKCFDTIWHSGLFYKLSNVLPDIHWRFLLTWYKTLDVVVKWNGVVHKDTYFKVTRGTRQGSILSPVLFNIFLSDLLVQLGRHPAGIMVGEHLFNSFAYADDVSLFSTTVPGLQGLIDICSEYAKQWRFKFGLNKTKCLITGKNKFVSEPIWYLNGIKVNTVSNLEILGVNFSSSGNYNDHVSSRMNKCKRSMFSLSNIGMSYPGLNTNSKVHLYKTICQPTLMYGLDCLSLTKRNIDDVQVTQGRIMKHVCGLGKRSRHSALLHALGISNAGNVISECTKSLFNRICSTDSPTRDLCFYFINLYVYKGILFPGTLVHRLVNLGVSPSSLVLSYSKSSSQYICDNGLVDSLRVILFDGNYVKPWSNEYLLVKLLTKSF